ncbi:HYR domain-containing protein [Streptomyces sp. NBC_00525]|uniref:HYR domain-containing protein n=1 Tax=Streptomyces sp. NBC_00525 TaxID=2903660 RepID=UPI002E81F637|nr:HYR domain-containing protein [Streptomyces sp. NBC_00525]WUC97333.1 HYR domain-containing protein [Streptomyces sp. NBC_00525]
MRWTRPAGRPRGPAGARRSAALAFLLLATAFVPASGASGAAPAVPAPPEPWVTPATLHESLDPGDSTGVDKSVRTPAIPPKPEVVLLVDGTGSMDVPIASVQQNLPEITEKVLAAQPESRFAVATFGDQQVDPGAGFKVLQGLTSDLDKVQDGVDALTTDLGAFSMGPSEDWINGLWQIAYGAGGETVFREGSNPVIVVVSDASSHSPSNGHTIDDTIFALQDKGVRVVGVDVDSDLGDGLDGDGDAGVPGQVEDPPTTPGQATRIVRATQGRLLEGIQGDQVAQAIIDGMDNLPTSVGYRLDRCSPFLSVSLDPPTRQLTSGETAHFAETVDVAPDAPQGARLTCTVQFLLGPQIPGTDTLAPSVAPDPDFQQKITIDVNDIDAPVVNLDDRIARADDENGTRISYRATAKDAQDGRLPVSCTPASGSLFPIGSTTVTCTATDTAGNTATDTADFRVLEPPPPPLPPPPATDVAVTADVTPGRTYIGRAAHARFTVTNAGPDTARDVVLSTGWPEPARAKDRTLTALTRCTAAAPCTIPPGGRIEVTQTGTYRAPLTGDVRATVRGTLGDLRPLNDRDTDRLRVLEPSLTVTPQVAKPGQPVIARGKDYPPGETVRLTWDTGITADRTGIRVGRDGTFEVQVLVLRKDLLGPRVLRADITGLPRLREPVLVVQRNLQPPDFKGRT